ncbi:hypothetical protein, partial [Shewanella algae]|uniref:hypothetical protein n=1 Tax=Shewanella algae TaxID=38313 RepID=UPI00399C06C9
MICEDPFDKTFNQGAFAALSIFEQFCLAAAADDFHRLLRSFFIGSSRISGERLSDFQKEVFGIPVAIAHSLQQ